MVAVASPFNEDYSLDLDALQTNIRYMVENGVHTGQGTLLVGGAGGEHPTMNVDERKAVMTAAMEAANGEAPVLTSVQHTDWRVIIELANHAHEAGQDQDREGERFRPRRLPALRVSCQGVRRLHHDLPHMVGRSHNEP